MPKLIAFHLLQNLVCPPLVVRLECIEGNFEQLLGELALNRIDLVIADQSAPHRANMKLHSHLLGKVDISFIRQRGPAQALRRELPGFRSGSFMASAKDGMPFQPCGAFNILP